MCEYWAHGRAVGIMREFAEGATDWSAKATASGAVERLAEVELAAENQSLGSPAMGLRWCRDVVILGQPKRYFDDR